MLKSHYQAVFWGKTPWSLLHALLWRLRGSEVLVIDDTTLLTRSAAHRWLSSLEILELKALGERYKIKPLLALDGFIRPSRLKIHTPQIQWVSQEHAQDNLRELVRKFPIFQTPLLLSALENATVAQDLARINRNFVEWFTSAQTRKRPVTAFRPTECPWFVEFQRLLLVALTRPYSSGKQCDVSQFVTAYSAATGQVVKYGHSEHETTYLALRLLSPMWELDQRWFEREMLRELESYGAHCKRAGIQSWQLGGDRVEAALLNSYEGVVVHERLLMYGFPLATAALQCRFKQRVYRGLEMIWPHHEKSLLEGPRAESCVVASNEMMGTDMPLAIWEDTQEAARLVVLVEERPGAKPEFYRAEAMEGLKPLLRQALGPEILQLTKKSEAWPLWLGEDYAVSHKAMDLHEWREIQVLERESRAPVLGVNYWGPLMTEKFGLLGYLTELRWDMV